MKALNTYINTHIRSLRAISWNMPRLLVATSLGVPIRAPVDIWMQPAGNIL